MSRLGRDPSHCCVQRRLGVCRIYGLYDGSDLRYIGQTFHSLTCRLSRHIWAATKSGRKSHLCCWIKSLSQNGKIPAIRLLQEVTRGDANEVEKGWIYAFRYVGISLVNFSDGGNMCGMLGKNHTLESRKKMSEACKGRVRSAQVIQRIAAKNRGKKRSIEQKQRLAAALQGIKRSADFCRRTSERMMRDAPRKKVCQYSISGEFIKVFSSIREAAKACGVSHPNISVAAKCKNFSRTCGGFKWRYSDGN